MNEVQTMDITQIKEFLFWVMLINFAMLAYWFLMIMFAKKFVYTLHRRWFDLTDKEFDKVHFSAMAFYKMSIILFVAVPWLVLVIMF